MTIRAFLQELDDLLFSPPHTFATILSFVAVRLGLAFVDDRYDRPSGKSSSDDEGAAIEVRESERRAKP